MPVVVMAAAAMAALALAGCGGGSSPSNSSSDPNLKQATSLSAQVIVRAESICKNVNAQLTASKPKSTSTAEIARVSPVHAAIERAGAEQLARLEASSPAAHELQVIVAVRRVLASELVQLGSAAKAHDTAAIRALTASKERAHAALSITARHLGLFACESVV